MNEFLEVNELQTEAKRLLHCRVPLVVAVVVNFVLLVRVPLTRMPAETVVPPASGGTVAEAGELSWKTPSPLTAISQEIEALPAELAPSVQMAVPAELVAVSEPPVSLPLTEPLASPPESRVPQRLAQWADWLLQFVPSARTAIATPPQIVVEPAEPIAEPASSMPAPGDSPATDATPSPLANEPDHTASAPQGLTLRNSLENGGPVSFLVNGRVYELLPGEAHEFSTGESWDVKFHRGESLGNDQRTLRRGVYRFIVTEHGWDLQAVTPERPL